MAERVWRILCRREVCMLIKKLRVDDSLESPETDPLGSYTGVVTDDEGNPLWEQPVQDADDL